MFNEAKLRLALFEHKIGMAEAAHSIGIDRVTFHRKMTGKTEFTLSEIKAVCDMLGIDDPRPIFFDGQVS